MNGLDSQAISLAVFDMKKRRKKTKPTALHPEQDHFLMRLKIDEKIEFLKQQDRFNAIYMM
ncbi:hypothetical protein ACFL7E_02395 [Thermodesulfobacteriota bacterium]